MLCRKKWWGSISLRVSCLCSHSVFLQALCFFSGSILSSLQFLSKKWNLFVTNKCHGEKWEWGLTSLKDVFCMLFTNYCFFARMLLLSYGKLRQIVTFFSNNFSMCIDHCTFLATIQNVNHTHCMLCRDLIFWETYCMIEGRFHLIGYHRKNGHISKKGVPHVLSILQGYSFLKEAMPFLEGKLQFMNDGWNVYSDMQIFCQGHETHCKISRQKNSSKTKLWEKSDALLMQFWCSFDVVFKTASDFSDFFQMFSKIFSDFLQDFLRFFKKILSHKNGPRGYERCFHKFIPTSQESTESFWKFHHFFSNVLGEKYQDSPPKLSYMSTVN